MDASRFDALARALVTVGSRRGLLGLVFALPLGGGLLAFLTEDDAAKAKGRRKRRKKRHKHGKGRRRKHHKKCKAHSTAKTCAGKCGLVKNNCKKTVNCGSCACEPPCAICQVCNGSSGTCEPDPDQQGDACGQPGEVCWNGACACGDVCASGCQFTSVQDAIDAASSGDTIHICAGAYLEHDILVSKDLTLLGAGDADDPGSNTILDANQLGPVLTVDFGVTAALQRLRFTGGANDVGGGVFNGHALTMTECTLTGNTAAANGGGIHSQGPSLTMTDCAIITNQAQNGGGIFSTSASTTLTECLVSGNEATGAGGGLFNEVGATTLLTSCTVTGNAADSDGGIYNASTLTLDGSDVRHNTANDVGGILNRPEFGATVTLTGGSTVCENSDPQCDGFTDAACTEVCPA